MRRNFSGTLDQGESFIIHKPSLYFQTKKIEYVYFGMKIAKMISIPRCSFIFLPAPLRKYPATSSLVGTEIPSIVERLRHCGGAGSKGGCGRNFWEVPGTGFAFRIQCPCHHLHLWFPKCAANALHQAFLFHLFASPWTLCQDSGLRILQSEGCGRPLRRLGTVGMGQPRWRRPI